MQNEASAAEPATEANQGRYFGFASVNVFPGGPGG
jgi:hypothetical protein